MFFSYVLFFLQFEYINFTVRINNKDIFILEKIISDLPEQKTFFFSPPEKSFWYWEALQANSFFGLWEIWHFFFKIMLSWELAS